MLKNKRKSTDNTKIEDSEATASAVSISSATLQHLLTAQAESNASMLEQQAKSNADLLERLLAKFPTSFDTASPSDTDPSTPRTKIKVPKWCDDETPHDYFTKYEQAMRHNGEPETQWGYLLPVYVSGKAQAAFKEIPDELLHDYNAVKTALLNSLGDTPSNAGRKWWTLACQSGETYNSLYLRVYTTNLRRLEGAYDRQSIIDRLAMSRFMSLLPYDCFNYVFSRNPKTGRKAADCY